MSDHYDVEATCLSCGESFLFNPPINNPAYNEVCCDCGGTIPVPADDEEAASE